MYPSYLNAYQNGSLQENAERLYAGLKDCNICPRNCGVDRLNNKLGFCKTGKQAKVYSYFSHYGEEPCISGNRGSGTIFFSNCNLKCVYCQNYQFSQIGAGKEVGEDILASFMIKLQGEGCHNINFVTPTHIIPQILKALILAIEKGLKIPLVYNTSGYESVETLKHLKGIFDIYLPDARYSDSKIALKYSYAENYPDVNEIVLKEMNEQKDGIVKLNQEGVMESGLIIRHLVLPNHILSTKRIMQFISDVLGKDTYISLMSQYFPCHKANDYSELSRRLTKSEYQEAIYIMYSFGLHNGWIQDDMGADKFIGTNIKSNLA